MCCLVMMFCFWVSVCDGLSRVIGVCDLEIRRVWKRFRPLNIQKLRCELARHSCQTGGSRLLFSEDRVDKQPVLAKCRLIGDKAIARLC